jgi:predicted dehydrogenase
MSMRCGIAGPGADADRFATGLAQLGDTQLIGAGSRDRQRAEYFVAHHGGRANGSYADLAEDPDVEVVYVASPASRHMDDTIIFL